jgi:hypothetical protein
MYYRVIDSFLHQLRAGRDELPAHDDLRKLYADAIDKLGLLADGLYKRDRKQADPIDRPDF